MRPKGSIYTYILVTSTAQILCEVMTLGLGRLVALEGCTNAQVIGQPKQGVGIRTWFERSKSVSKHHATRSD